MKSCPKCRADYFDEMLEFCLEDGAKLTVVSRSAATVTKPRASDPKSADTVSFDARADLPKTVAVNEAATLNVPPAAETKPTLKQKTVERGYRTMEIGTLALALAHNWWQWLYIERQSYGTISNFLFSAEFLIWILLLAAGTTSGLLTVKFSRKKELAYVGLIILAVNFLFLLVPKK
jgi:hypothetical protein